jgi:DNA-directed RNA polymerase subunit H (RpoH/RPB5)
MGFFQRLGLKKKQQKHQPLDEEEQQRIVDELEVEEAVIVRDEYNVEEEDADSSSTISSDHSEVMPPSSNASIYSGKYIKVNRKSPCLLRRN